MIKASLRKDFLSKRLALSSDEVILKTSHILTETQNLLTGMPFRVIHIFLSQANKGEIDTLGIISAIRKLFPQVLIAVPCVVPGTREMRHFDLTSQTLLKENKWGIPEPDPFSAMEIFPEAIDMVLIPLLAFDKQGYRVGYGGGYYDRFLEQCRPDVVKIGLSFFEPVDQIEDTGQHDVPLNYCVTPEKVWRW